MMHTPVNTVFPNMRNFKPHEFVCKCGCGFLDMKPVFLWKLEQAREYANMVFNVTSGCRCEEHNRNEGGKKTSEHLTGDAADIETRNSRERFKIVMAAFSAGIIRIGIGKDFIHLGDGKNKNKMVMWTY